MVYSDLGDTGEKISAIGFGAWAIGGHGYGEVDDRRSIGAVRKALDIGINVFDTADVYGFGHSEEVLSRALGDRIRDVIVATKFGVRWDDTGRTVRDCSVAYLGKALEGSLRRLKTDCIPLYQLHWHDGVTPLAAVLEALSRFRDEGKIRHIGCSNIPSSAFRDATWQGAAVSAQMRFSVVSRESMGDLTAFREEFGMATLVYGVLDRGLLTGKYSGDSRFGQDDTRGSDSDFQERLLCAGSIVKLLRSVAAKYDKTPSQVAIRWVLENPFVSCALVGAKTEEQVLENAGAVGWRLDESDRDLLISLGKRH